MISDSAIDELVARLAENPRNCTAQAQEFAAKVAIFHMDRRYRPCWLSADQLATESVVRGSPDLAPARPKVSALSRLVPRCSFPPSYPQTPRQTPRCSAQNRASSRIRKPRARRARGPCRRLPTRPTAALRTSPD